jgi:cell division septation protein DedD
MINATSTRSARVEDEKSANGAERPEDLKKFTSLPDGMKLVAINASARDPRVRTRQPALSTLLMKTSAINMSQDTEPVIANASEEEHLTESLPSQPVPAATTEAPRANDRHAPNAYAVGIRVLRMAPAWLLTTTVSFALLILLLSWMNAGNRVVADTPPPAHNDARALTITPAPAVVAASRKADAPSEAAVAPTSAPSNEAPATNDKPVPTNARETLSAVAQTASAAAPEPPKTVEETQAAAAVNAAVNDDHADAKFTVQVGSFNDESEANERVSGLRASGFESRATEVEIRGRGKWYRVQVGRFADRAGATKALADLRAKGAGAGAIILPLQN